MSNNFSIVTRPIERSIEEQWQLFDSLPKLVREVLREANYDYDAGTAHDVIAQVREHYRGGFGTFLSAIESRADEREVILEAARHIRDTDNFVAKQNQRQMIEQAFLGR
jgi:hypothetical protein